MTFSHALRGISFTDALHGWAVDSTAIYATHDGGATWLRQRLPPNMTFVADVSFAAPQEGFAAGAAGNAAAVATTTDSGAKWKISYVGRSGSFFRVDAAGACTIAAGGSKSGSGGLISTSVGRSSWRSMPAPSGAGTVLGAWCSRDRRVVAARDRIGSAVFEETASKHWKRARTPSGLGAGQIAFGYGHWWLAGDGGVFISPVAP